MEAVAYVNLGKVCDGVSFLASCAYRPSEAFRLLEPLLFNWRCSIEEVAAFFGQQKFLMPGIVLSARYAKMNKAECPPLINSMLQRQESK